MKKLLIVLGLMTLTFGMLQAAVIPVVNDSDSSLVTAYNNAAAGDILELTVDGVYLSKAQIELDMDITIRAAEGLANKPVYKYVGTSTGAYMFKGVGSPRISISGIEFDGDGQAEGGAALAKYFFIVRNDDTTATLDLFMDDLYVHTYNEKIIKFYGNAGVDSMVVTNSWFDETTKEGITLYSGSSSDPAAHYNYVEFTDCTISNTNREAIKNQTSTGGTVVLDRLTLDGCGNDGGKSMIYFRDIDDVTVKNSIFYNSTNDDAGEEFADMATSNNQFHNNVVWSVVNTEVSNATLGDTLHVDPMFVDAAMGDYTVLNEALYTFADDGGSVGDSYWIPNREPALYQISNDVPNAMAEAVNDAIAGDIIELVSDGVYLNTSQMVIGEDITIRAWDLLPNKPVVKYAGDETGAYMFKGIGSPRISISGIEFDGDGQAEGGAALAKYFFIVRNDDTTATLDLFMDDLYVHTYNEKIIKFYGNAGVDSMVVTNSVFDETTKEGITLYSGSSSDPGAHYNYVEISNCTISNTNREAIKNQTSTGGTVVLDRLTLDGCGNDGGKSMIYFRDVDDVTVKNSIFYNSTNDDAGEEFADMATDVNVFHNNIVWEVFNTEVSNAVVTDTMHVDPMFADVANMDYEVGNTALYSYADDGGSVGDSRWIPAVEVVVTEVTNDALNSLADAVEASAPGDILELVSDGVYTFDVEIALEHDITIRGSSALASMPVVQYVGTSSTHMFRGYGSSHISISNIEFNGNRPDGGNAKYFVRLDNGDPTATLDLFVDNVIAHDYGDKIIKAYGSTGIDSVVITNSVFYGGASEGICLYEGSSSAQPTVINYAEVSNCTIYDIEREAIKAELYADSEILIDRVTIYDCGSFENKPMIRFRAVTDLEVKNSIFVHNDNSDTGEDFADLGEASNLFHHNVVWDMLNYETGSATATDTAQVDPMFADAANADFTLPEDSPLYSFADDGGSIGDTRWAPPLGVYFLNTFVVGGGTVELDPPGGEYAEGTSVTLTAVPDFLYAFDHWEPSITFPPNNPVATVVMTESRNITAHFAPTVTEFDIITDVIGYGHIEETHGAQYPVEGYIEGDTLELVAVADSADWEFAYWVNAENDSIADGDIYYIIDADTSFTAMFRSTLPQAMLSLTTVGMGDVSISPMPVPGFDTYDAGTELTLTATAPLGLEFAGWSGDVTSTDNPLMVTLAADMAITATFTEISHPDGILAIDSSWDILDALEYTANNTQAYRILLTDVGPYLPSEENRVDGKMPQLDIEQTVEIMGADTLAAKPQIMGYTSSTAGSSSEGFFRLRMGSNLTLKHLAIDGWMDGAASQAKYIVRADDSDNFGYHTAFRAFDVDFKSTIEAFYKNYASAIVDSLIMDGCIVEDIGKEGLFFNNVGEASLISVTNSTFKRVGREILYMKGMDPVTILDHLTIENCGIGYGTEGDKFAAVRAHEGPTNVTFTNSIIANVTNTVYDYAVRIGGADSYIDNILLHNSSTNVELVEDAMAGPDIFWYDPMFADVATEDYTLNDSSYAYHLQNDESAAIGDLRWATSTAIVDYATLDVMVEGGGSVMLNPEPELKFYAPGTIVSATATPDSLWAFVNWTGDVTSDVSPVDITMDADKMITANFEQPMFTVTFNVNMKAQIYEDRFDPMTDSLDVAGSFNGWGGEALWLYDDDNDSIWTVEVDFLALAENVHEYKFRINASWSDETAEFPFGGPARQITVVEDMEVNVWYNDQDFTALADALLPEVYALNQNYPNPFNPTTTISFDLIENADTRLVLYDVRGRELQQLVNKNMAPGRYSVTLDASAYASGVYFYRLISGEFTDVKKLMLLK